VSEVAIIGAGPAGIAAAIQLRRYDIQPLLFEADAVGGMAVNANLIENYPGFPRGVSGRNLVSLFQRQLRAAEIPVVPERVVVVEKTDAGFRIVTGKADYQSARVILASGTSPKEIDIPGAPRLTDEMRRRIISEVKSILEARDRDIAIIGAGDAAFDYALNLSRANRVSINNRGDRSQCLPLLIRRASQIATIQYRENATLAKVDSSGIRLALTWSIEGRITVEPVDYLLTAIGRTPNIGIINSIGEAEIAALQSLGYLKVIGDAGNGRHRQVGIAVGDGVRAAMEVAAAIGAC